VIYDDQISTQPGWVEGFSYSLYLWQQLFFTDRFLGTRPLGRIEGWPLNLGLTFLVAALSYYGVERDSH
jgi:peptidoglycan/LPS O-acetylase OafA/YrhL